MIQPGDATSTVSSVFPLWIELGTLIMSRAMSENCRNRKRQALFDHLVRARGKGRRDFETERFRRLDINAKQEFSGLLNRKLGRVAPWSVCSRSRTTISAVGAKWLPASSDQPLTSRRKIGVN